MPYYKKRNIKRKPYKKKATKYRRRKAAPLLPNNPQYTIGGAIKKTHLVNLAYRHHGTLSSTSGLLDSQLFRMNSIFDPDYSGVGGQPLAHDQWAQFYGTYKVIGCKITTHFMWNGSSAVGQAHRVGHLFDRDTTVQTDSNAVIEKLHGRQTRILKGNSRDSQTVISYYSGKKFFGKSFNDHQHQALFGANPTAPAICCVWVSALDGNSSGYSILYDSLVEYIVLLSDPIALAAS